jgi:hypothetical protein
VPAVKYVHLENLGSGKWAGVNIYLMNDQKVVRVYVLERKEGS